MYHNLIQRTQVKLAVRLTIIPHSVQLLIRNISPELEAFLNSIDELSRTVDYDNDDSIDNLLVRFTAVFEFKAILEFTYYNYFHPMSNIRAYNPI
jgi:hypothetical protein